MTTALTPAQTWWNQREDRKQTVHTLLSSFPKELTRLVSEYDQIFLTLEKVQAIYSLWQNESLKWLLANVFRFPAQEPVDAYFGLPVLAPFSPQALPENVKTRMRDAPFPSHMVDAAGKSYPVMRGEKEGAPLVAVHVFRAYRDVEHTHSCFVFYPNSEGLSWIQTSEMRLFNTDKSMELWFQRVQFKPCRNELDPSFECLLCPKMGYQFIQPNTHRKHVPIHKPISSFSITSEFQHQEKQYFQSQHQNRYTCNVSIEPEDLLTFPSRKRKAEEAPT